MTVTRDEHLAWCKQRAIQYLETGDLAGAAASMISDLGKWKEPLYDPMLLNTLAMDGIMFRKTVPQMRNWIEGFN
jgi:hypothetical protein